MESLELETLKIKIFEAQQEIAALKSYIEKILIPTNKKTVVRIAEPINEYHIINLKESFSNNDKLRTENNSLRTELLAAREALNKYIDNESWIDRNRKQGWNEAVYIKSMGEMKEYAREALTRLDKFLKGGV